MLELQFEIGQFSPHSIELLESAANRLALALENARLLEDSDPCIPRTDGKRISARVRAESDVEKGLQTVAAELGHSLGVSMSWFNYAGPNKAPEE